MPLQVEEFISVCPELTFGARQFLRSCYQTHLAVEFDTLSVECLRGERRGQYLIVYEVTCPGGEIATGCSRGDGLDTGHAMKPGQMRLDFTPKVRGRDGRTCTQCLNTLTHHPPSTSPGRAAAPASL